MLRHNRDALFDQGFYVPASLGPLEHHHLVSIGIRAGRFFSPLSRAGVRSKAEVKEFKLELRKEFKSELLKVPSTSTLTLSSERCFRVLTNEDEIERLVKFLSRLCDEVRVVVYLRPQHDFCTSLYSTQLKNGFVDDDILPSDPSKMPQLNYHAMLQRWANVVGHDNIDVRLFDRSMFLDGDIRADFFTSVLGVDMATLESIPNQNESLSVEAQLFLRTLNQYLPRYEDKKVLSTKRANIGGLLGQVASGKGMLPTESEAREFYALFAESNELVRQTWFPERSELFNIDFSKYPATKPDYELSQEAAFEIFANLWAAKQNQVDFLARKRQQ